MIDHIRVDFANVQAAAGEVRALQTGLDQVVRTLTAKLAAEGEPWGHDSMGTEFGKQYVPGVGNLTRASGEMARVLGSYATGMADSVANFRQNEDLSANAIR